MSGVDLGHHDLTGGSGAVGTPSIGPGGEIIEPGYVPPVEDDYVHTYGPPHIRELGYWGIGLTIISALFMSSGLCLQKVVVRKVAQDPDLGPAYKHSLYIAGVAYVTMGLALKAFIDMMLPQSAIATLSAQTVLYTTLLEYMFLDGEMTRLTVVALIIVSLGMALATFGSNTVDGEYSLHDLWDLFMRRTSIIVSASLVAFIVAAREFVRNSTGSFTGIRGLVYMSITAGLFAGWFGTAVKSTFEVIKFAFLRGMDTADATHSGLWILLASLPLLGVPKLRYVGAALAEFHHLQFLPLYQSAAIAANAMCGIVYFNDFGTSRIHGTRVSPPLYFMGLGLVCGGTMLLAHRYNPAKHLVAYEEEESQSLLWAGDDMDKEEEGSFRYKDEFGSRDARTPLSSRIAIKSAAFSPARPRQGATALAHDSSQASSSSAAGSALRGGRQGMGNVPASGGMTPLRNAGSSSGRAGMSTPTKYGRGDRDGGESGDANGNMTVSTPPPLSRGRVTPSRSGAHTPTGAFTSSAASSPSFSAVAKKGYGVEEALALAQIQNRGHRRVHSGVMDPNLREILSPFEGSSDSITGGRDRDRDGAGMGLTPQRAGQMQALYVGSMQGLDVGEGEDEDEEKKGGERR